MLLNVTADLRKSATIPDRYRTLGCEYLLLAALDARLATRSSHHVQSKSTLPMAYTVQHPPLHMLHAVDEEATSSSSNGGARGERSCS